MPHFDQVYDPGLQQERTNLAWDRTGLAVMVASGFLVRAMGEPFPRPVHVLPAVTFLIGLGLLASDRSRYIRRWHRLAEGEEIMAWLPIAIVGITTVVVGLTALAVVLG